MKRAGYLRVRLCLWELETQVRGEGGTSFFAFGTLWMVEGRRGQDTGSPIAGPQFAIPGDRARSGRILPMSSRG